MYDTLQKNIIHVLSLIEIQSVSCGKIRIGGPNDGGYVMANNFFDNKIAYSIGVGPQVQWDVEMANRGLMIYQYDHTVDGLPEQHPNFNYNHIGIGSDFTDPQLITLAEMLRRNGHENETNMILKIDVEGAEWDVFDTMDSDLLLKFDQIVIEFHGLELIREDSFRERCTRVFQKFTKNHTPIHIHGNNFGPMVLTDGVVIPGVIELSFCKRGRFDFSPSDEIFPTELDEPCLPGSPDIFLGNFKFKRRAA